LERAPLQLRVELGLRGLGLVLRPLPRALELALSLQLEALLSERAPLPEVAVYCHQIARSHHSELARPEAELPLEQLVESFELSLWVELRHCPYWLLDWCPGLPLLVCLQPRSTLFRWHLQWPC